MGRSARPGGAGHGTDEGTGGESQREVARRAVQEHGLTYARQAGLTLTDTPSALYRLLVLTVLLANRLPATAAVGAAAAVSRAGLRTPATMAAATWQERGDVLAASGYRRLAGRTATVLGAGAEMVLERWGGDLRRLRDESGGEAPAVRRAVETVPGIGRLGSAIFCREAQGVWPQLAPFADERVVLGAQALGLPTTGPGLAALVPPADLVHLVAACVRASFGIPRPDPA
jgi:hypothetical protein